MSEKGGGEHSCGSRTQPFNKLGTLKKSNVIRWKLVLHNEKPVKRETKDIFFLTMFLKHTEMPCSGNSMSIFLNPNN